MSTSKIDELFDTLRAACARQFVFNPRRISERMRYVGKEGNGKDLVHVFKDAGRTQLHAQLPALSGPPRKAVITLQGDLPGYQAGGPNPREAAKAFVDTLAAAQDSRLAAFAEQMHSNDPEHLAHLLLAPCHLELEAIKH